MNNRSKPLPSRTFLRECFEYDLFTGEAYWLERPQKHFSNYLTWSMWNGKFAHIKVGNIHKKTGYYHTSVNSTQYTVHRLVWKWWYGTDPLEIDHIDKCRTNNRITNLRSVTNTQNAQNRTLSSNNTSGYPGVSCRNGKWVARTYYQGKRIWLGKYNSQEEAHAAIVEFNL